MISDYERHMEQKLPQPEGYTEMMSYIGARLAGKQPEAAAAAAAAFVDDAYKTWAEVTMPTRRELFATIERTLLDELP